MHAGFSGLRAFVARKKSRCKLIGNCFELPHDTIPSNVVLNCKKPKCMKETLVIILILISQITFSQDNKTVITPTINHELDGENILYCPTFEISWINLKQSLFEGEDIKIKSSPYYLKYLNDSKVNLEDFSSTQSLTYSGIVSQAIADSLNKIKNRQFSQIETNFSEYIGSLISYACIDLKLKYKTDFEIMHYPLVFDSNKVKSFGIKFNPYDHKEIGKQVSVIDYKNEDNFIVELKLNDKDYELYLAKVPSEENVYEIYNQVNLRIEKGIRDTLFFNDYLQIPIIDFDLKRVYSELMNKNFKNKCCNDLYFNSVYQSIKLRMDEKGVDMVSESLEEVFCVAKHFMIFNKPYMILIKKSDSDLPIFVGWIENSEFMIKE